MKFECVWGGGSKGRSIQTRENLVKRKPDLVVVLVAAFGLGVLVTLLLPMAANDTVAAPASALHAGVLLGD